LDLLVDRLARQAALVGPVAHRRVHLGREHHVLALAARERLADDRLGLAVRGVVRGVDEVDAGIERRVDDANRLVVVAVAPGAEHHGAEAERRDLETGTAEIAVFHAQLRRPFFFIHSGLSFDRYRSPESGSSVMTIASSGSVRASSRAA